MLPPASRVEEVLALAASVAFRIQVHLRIGEFQRLGIMKDHFDTVDEARFLCSVCNKEAGHIQLLRGPSSAELRRNSFTSSFSSAVSHEHFDKLRRAIADHDARAF